MASELGDIIHFAKHGRLGVPQLEQFGGPQAITLEIILADTLQGRFLFGQSLLIVSEHYAALDDQDNLRI